ncbi:MAG: hypothetical protein HZB75_02285 [Candidatus Saccharibacteria bacterium]|nr:MAG: hypothetical protein HZB75_02285 [Candidatus Saccharibacteria bacterium]
MSSRRTFTMPARREVLQRLATVSPSQHHAQYLHSQVANYSSTDLTAEGVVTMLTSEIEAYCTRFQSGAMAVTLTMLVPGYIKALVRDQRVQSEALRIFAQVDTKA